jgi:hypothetical protein
VLLASIQVAIHSVFDRKERSRNVFGVGSLPQLAVQKIQNLRCVGVAVLARCLIEGHHPEATSLKAVHERKNVTDFPFNVKGNVLESAQVEKGLHSELLDGRMLNKGYE